LVVGVVVYHPELENRLKLENHSNISPLKYSVHSTQLLEKNSLSRFSNWMRVAHLGNSQSYDRSMGLMVVLMVVVVVGRVGLGLFWF